MSLLSDFQSFSSTFVPEPPSALTPRSLNCPFRSSMTIPKGSYTDLHTPINTNAVDLSSNLSKHRSIKRASWPSQGERSVGNPGGSDTSPTQPDDSNRPGIDNIMKKCVKVTSCLNSSSVNQTTAAKSDSSGLLCTSSAPAACPAPPSHSASKPKFRRRAVSDHQLVYREGKGGGGGVVLQVTEAHLVRSLQQQQQQQQQQASRRVASALETNTWRDSRSVLFKRLTSQHNSSNLQPEPSTSTSTRPQQEKKQLPLEKPQQQVDSGGSRSQSRPPLWCAGGAGAGGGGWQSESQKQRVAGGGRSRRSSQEKQELYQKQKNLMKFQLHRGPSADEDLAADATTTTAAAAAAADTRQDCSSGGKASEWHQELQPEASIEDYKLELVSNMWPYSLGEVEGSHGASSGEKKLLKQATMSSQGGDADIPGLGGHLEQLLLDEAGLGEDIESLLPKTPSSSRSGEAGDPSSSHSPPAPPVSTSLSSPPLNLHQPASSATHPRPATPGQEPTPPSTSKPSTTRRPSGASKSSNAVAPSTIATTSTSSSSSSSSPHETTTRKATPRKLGSSKTAPKKSDASQSGRKTARSGGAEEAGGQGTSSSPQEVEEIIASPPSPRSSLLSLSMLDNRDDPTEMESSYADTNSVQQAPRGREKASSARPKRGRENNFEDESWEMKAWISPKEEPMSEDSPSKHTGPSSSLAAEGECLWSNPGQTRPSAPDGARPRTSQGGGPQPPCSTSKPSVPRISLSRLHTSPPVSHRFLTSRSITTQRSSASRASSNFLGSSSTTAVAARRSFTSASPVASHHHPQAPAFLSPRIVSRPSSPGTVNPPSPQKPATGEWVPSPWQRAPVPSPVEDMLKQLSQERWLHKEKQKMIATYKSVDSVQEQGRIMRSEAVRQWETVRSRNQAQINLKAGAYPPPPSPSKCSQTRWGPPERRLAGRVGSAGSRRDIHRMAMTASKSLQPSLQSTRRQLDAAATSQAKFAMHTSM